MEFDHVHDSDRNTVIKRFTSTSIVKDRFGIAIHTSFFNSWPKVFRTCSVKDWCCDVNTKSTSSHTKVKLHNLTDIHTWWHPKWVQHDIDWSSIWKVRHVFYRNDTRDNPFVSVTSGHLISDLDLTFLSDVNANQHVDTWLQLISICTCKDLNITNDTIGTVWYAKRSITHFTRFISEDSVQETFFSWKVFLTLRCYFTYKDITFFNLSTDTDNTHFVKVFKGIFTNVWNFTSDFFRPKLCIACFWFVFFKVDRCIDIVFNQAFAHDNGILEVVTFPSHVGNDWVLSKRHFSIFHRRSVSDEIAFFNDIANFNKRALVVSSTWVWTTEFLDVVNVQWTIFTTNFYLVSICVSNFTIILSNHSRSRVVGCLVFHTSTNVRCLRIDQWHSLTLHVGSHEGTVGVIVFQERNTCCRNGNYLFWWYVHVVNNISWILLVDPLVTSHDNFLSKCSIFIQTRISLCYSKFIFFIGCQPNDFVRDNTCFTVNFTVWCLNKTIFVQVPVRWQVVNQTDVRSFRCLDWTHTSVVSVVHVTHFISSAVTCQTARS